MYKLVKKSEGTPRQISDSYHALNLITKEVTPNLSLAVTTGTDFEDKTATEYDRIYYVLEGRLTLIFDNQEVVLEEGDSCFISAETKYTMKGTFRSVIVNQPAFGTK